MIDRLPVAIEAAAETLADFDELTRNLKTTSDRQHFAPYLLDGSQVGAVAHLLWKAKRIAEENRELRLALDQTQRVVDDSICYLDPDRK